jgi:hypothetical protein
MSSCLYFIVCWDLYYCVAPKISMDVFMCRTLLILIMLGIGLVPHGWIFMRNLSIYVFMKIPNEISRIVL